MSYDETFVGALAIILAIISTVIAVGPWDAPYQLKTVSLIAERYGKSAARGFWVVVAIATFAAGLAIVSGTRPAYVSPAHQSPIDR